MADYTKTTDFAAKDGYASGNPSKAVVGTEIDDEFNNIATAVATKYDSTNVADTATAQAMLDDLTIITPAKVLDIFQGNGGMLEDIQALADPNADTVLGWDDSASAAIGWTIGTGLGTTAGGALEMSHLGIEDLTGPGGDRIMFWDQSSGATGWLTVSTGLTLSTTNLTTNDAQIAHDSLSGFVANEHIDHSSVSITAGNGLTGGGTIASTRTINVGAGSGISVAADSVALDISGLTNIEGNVVAATDSFLVNDGGTMKQIDWQDAGFPVQTSQTSQTLAASDMNTIMEFNSTYTLTIPLNSSVSLPVGSCVIICNDNASTYVTVTAAASVTLNSVNHAGGATAASDKVSPGGTACLIKTQTNEWYLSGNIED